ncbi:unnamed protein product [Rhizophagus irregularis]|nr:unnamed protein product [Rhizophagus irregularis]
MVQRNGVPINLNFYTIITTPIKKELKKWLKGCKTLRDSIKDYIQEETLDRDNNIIDCYPIRSISVAKFWKGYSGYSGYNI